MYNAVVLKELYHGWKIFAREEKKKNLSQEELARRAKISIASIRNCEQVLRDPNKMSIENYKKICFVLCLEKGEGL